MNDDYGWQPATESIFGFWLPFIGFDTIAVNADGHPLDPSEFEEGRDYPSMRVFMIAWLGKALIIKLSDGD